MRTNWNKQQKLEQEITSLSFARQLAETASNSTAERLRRKLKRLEDENNAIKNEMDAAKLFLMSKREKALIDRETPL